MMFAIIGINFAKGKLYYCDMGDNVMHYVTKEEVNNIVYDYSVKDYGEYMIVILRIFFRGC